MWLFTVLVVQLAFCSAAPLGFTGPFPGLVVNATIATLPTAATSEQCAEACTAHPGCISFNWPGCALSSWSTDYLVMDDPSASHFNRNAARNDSRATIAVPPLLSVPTSAVELVQGGIFRTYFDRVIPYLLGYNVDDLLYYFRARAGMATPPGHDRIHPGCTSPNNRSFPRCGWEADGPHKPLGLKAVSYTHLTLPTKRIV
eukprot:TRINITY_DN62407_c0_g1_i1.p1 TRINITY_DN62407_c0_g1~~TRINITY_DN62407_c0_g1_i1.p1  ORF type:complete len:201 (-),score=36.43 TRINITY_DN62407_c0_g1_i1:87-689(-)